MIILFILYYIIYLFNIEVGFHYEERERKT
jgi:hypothetical protein